MSVEKLKKRIEQNKERRDDEKRLYEHVNARQILVDEAPDSQDMDFYCATCNEHRSYLGKKTIQYGIELDKDMNVIGEYRVEPIRASFVAVCRKGHGVRRYITDKERDPYFRSPILRMMARTMEDDMLQPDDPRFAKVYPKQWAELQRQKEEQMIIADRHGNPE